MRKTDEELLSTCRGSQYFQTLYRTRWADYRDLHGFSRVCFATNGEALRVSILRHRKVSSRHDGENESFQKICRMIVLVASLTYV
jgi:hypothetical protein